MTNEEYLTVSYLLVGLSAAGVGLAAYLWLRRPFERVAEAVTKRPVGQILKRLLSVGIVTPVLVGFLSVSFRSCERDTYSQIVADRAYLAAKNREQASESLTYLALAVLAWDFVILGTLFAAKHGCARSR